MKSFTRGDLPARAHSCGEDQADLLYNLWRVVDESMMVKGRLLILCTIEALVALSLVSERSLLKQIWQTTAEGVDGNTVPTTDEGLLTPQQPTLNASSTVHQGLYYTNETVALHSSASTTYHESGENKTEWETRSTEGRATVAAEGQPPLNVTHTHPSTQGLPQPLNVSTAEPTKKTESAEGIAPTADEWATPSRNVPLINPSADHHQYHHQYHVWGNNSTSRIRLQPLLKLINETFYGDRKGMNLSYLRYGPFPAIIAVDDKENSPTVWVPYRPMNWKRKKIIIEGRLSIMLPNWQRALQVHLPQHSERFPALMQALTTVGSIPLFLDLSDYMGCCNAMNTNEEVVAYNESSPVPDVAYFTISKPVSCNYGFPIPSYSSYHYAEVLRKNNHTWGQQMSEWNTQYPWESKINQVYWTGANSGRFLTHRFRFLRRVAQARNASIFNVHPSAPVCDACPSPTNHTSPQEESMRYKVTFDLDGNAWSERFPRLLCYNSAVIKLDVPHENEEYFMGHTVLPGIHYIPASLSNFTRVAEMALQNDDLLQQVVRNANAWCAQHMLEQELNLDFLSVLEGYVGRLEENWGQEWKRQFAAHVGPSANDGGHGGFTDSVLQNGTVYYKPKVSGLTGPTPWDLDEYIRNVASRDRPTA